MNCIFGKIRTVLGARPLKGRLGEALALAYWMGGFRGRAQVDRILDAVTSLSGSLGGVAGRFEPHFIRLGGQLQSAADEALQLTEHTQATIETIQGRTDDDLLGRVAKLAEASLTEFKSSQTHMSGSLDSIDTCVDHLKALNGHTGTIEKIALVLRVIGLNIAVESSRSEEGRAMFGVVAQDVIALSQEIRQTVSQLCRHAEEATQIQQEAYREVISGFQEAAKLADGAETSVRGAAEDVEKLMALAVEALESAQRHSQAISEQVGQVVAGIQFHDSMSQRLAHMLAALNDLPQLCRQPPVGSNGRNGIAGRLAEARAVVALQHTQLGQVIREAQAVHRKNKSAFETIYREIDALVEGLMHFGHPQKNRATGFDGKADAFQNLLNALENLHALLKRSASMRTRIHRALNEAGASADNLADQSTSVRRVSRDIHLLALNAIVKAAHMNEGGRTLEVLAQEVRILSHQANEFVDRYHRLLGDITSTSADRQGAEDMSTGPDAVGDMIGQGIEAIRDAYGRFQAGAERAVTAAEALKQRIQTVQCDLDFFDQLDSTLSGFQKQLGSIQADLDHWTGNGRAGATPFGSQLSQRYTMEQERIIHDQVFHTTGARDFSPEPDASGEDGIELFETGAPAHQASPDDADLEGFEDFSDAGPATGDPAASNTGKAEEAFDDNIELF